MYMGDFVNLPFPMVIDGNSFYQCFDRSVKVYKTRREGDDDNFKQLYRFTRENVNFVAQMILKPEEERYQKYKK